MSLMKRKLQDEIVGRMGFAMVPTELFAKLKGEPYELVVWAYLFNQSEGWHPSYSQIADGTGISLAQAKRSVAALVEKKLLIKHSNPLGGKNAYEFTEISSWNIGSQDENSNDLKGSLYQRRAVSQNGPFLEESIPFKEKTVEPLKTLDAPTTSAPVVKTFPTTTSISSPESTPPVASKDVIEAPPVNPKTTAQANIRATPSIDEIRLDWESRHSIATESPNFNTRLSLLQELMATYKSHGYSIDDVNSRSNRTKILEHYYKRIKKKSAKEMAERSSLEDWEAALGLLVEGTVKVSQAPKKPSNHHIAAFEDKTVDLENQLTDEEIDRMLDEQ